MNEEETKRDNLSVYQLGDRVAAGLKRLGDRDKELAELLRDMIRAYPCCLGARPDFLLTCTNGQFCFRRHLH